MQIPNSATGPSLPFGSDWQFRLLVDGVKDYALYLLSPEGKVLSWNNGAARIKGYAAEEIIGQPFTRFFTPEDRDAGAPERSLSIAERDGRFETEGQRVRKDGSRFWVHVVIDAIKDDSGSLVAFTKITRDITQQKTSGDLLKQVTDNLALALSSMSQGLCLFDGTGHLLLSNKRAAEIFGLKEAALQAGSSFDAAIGAMIAGSRGRDDAYVREEGELVVRRHRDMIDKGEQRAFVEELTDGRSVSIAHRVLAEGGWLTTFEDVTERKLAEAKIIHLARYDGLTGLPNRMTFNEYLGQELDRARRGQQKVGVIGIDLNRFKEINDVHGHAIGDLVLITLANRMREVLGLDEFVARLGGDEFSAAIRFTDPSAVSDLVRRLEVCLFEPVVLESLKIAIGASMGVAVFPNDGAIAEQLIKNADLAMYRAKASPGRGVCFYEAEMDEVVRQRRAVASELWTAIEENEFVVAYQVQQSVGSGRTVGCEALLRWQHPRRGLVQPNDFIPIAEECGAIVALGEWVLRKACKDAASWPQGCKVAVNLSPIQLRQPDLPEIVGRVLAETGVAPGRLELEITESAIIADKASALDILQRIRALGVAVALDDFGVGYSSLDTLKSFPFDRIKLDRSFVSDIATNLQTRAVVQAVLTLGHSLSVPVLAEGVETETQLAMLRAEGCDEVQGFLLGRPKIGCACGG